MRRLSDRVCCDLGDIDHETVERVVTAALKELFADLTDSFLLERRVGDPVKRDTYRALASDVFEQERVY